MVGQDRVAEFQEQGFSIARGLVADSVIAALRAELDGWIEQSRSQTANWGETVDGRRRFDLEPGHSPEAPRLRRVANPVDISEAYRRVLFEGPLVAAVAALLGPDVVFHHCKLNNKLPGMAARVDWHQDHVFDPHTNDSVVVALVMLDDMSEANGCLRIVPGSQRERHSHYDGERFVGATPAARDAEFLARSLPVVGRAGDVCLMHTWCLHGSPANGSLAPRRLLICDYAAADARPLRPPIMASAHSGRVVHGRPSRTVRLTADVIDLPPSYGDDSFFSVQDLKTAALPQVPAAL